MQAAATILSLFILTFSKEGMGLSSWENHVFDNETNQSFVFGTKKFELSYLAPS